MPSYRDWQISDGEGVGVGRMTVLEQCMACQCCRQQQQQSSQEARMAVQAGRRCWEPKLGEGGALPTERGCGM